MHAVFDPPLVDDGAGDGFLDKGIGAVPPAVLVLLLLFLIVVLLILFLRLIDAGPQHNLAWASLHVESREVQVTRPRRPPQRGLYLGEVFFAHKEYRTSRPFSPRRTLARVHDQSTRDYLLSRQDLFICYPLHGP